MATCESPERLLAVNILLSAVSISFVGVIWSKAARVGQGGLSEPKENSINTINKI